MTNKERYLAEEVELLRKILGQLAAGGGTQIHNISSITQTQEDNTTFQNGDFWFNETLGVFRLYDATGINTIEKNSNDFLILPTANTTTTLDNLAINRIIFTGSTFGKVLNLGDATTYSIGKTFHLFNNSIQTISIVNNSLIEIYRLEPYCKLEIVLEDNTTTNGVWMVNVTYADFNKLTLLLEDFIATVTSSATSGQGQTGWTMASLGAGATTAVASTLFGRYGVNSLSTGTTSGGRTCLNKGGNILLFSNGVTVWEASVRLANLSTPTETYIYYAGFGDNALAGDQTDGVYFEYNEEVSGNFWSIKTANNTVRTTEITSIPILVNEWYKLKIEIAPNGTRVDYFINDINIGFINTNIPTAIDRNTGILFKIQKTVGATARLAYVDYTILRAYITR
jgi:hypothetical protein